MLEFNFAIPRYRRDAYQPYLPVTTKSWLDAKSAILLLGATRLGHADDAHERCEQSTSSTSVSDCTKKELARNDTILIPHFYRDRVQPSGHS